MAEHSYTRRAVRRAARIKSLLLLAGGLLGVAPVARASLSDTLVVALTNSLTGQPAAATLVRYNLRASNYQVRIYSDATNYTLLPASEIPEVTTYRGRIATDPGALVVGTFDPNGNFIYVVTYGCREVNTWAMDPYDTTNRVMWGGWGTSMATTNLPALGTYAWSYRTNMPQPLASSTGYWPGAVASPSGGPPILNNLQRVPAQRVRMIQDMSRECFINSCGSNINYAILMQESRVNEMDYLEARDFGVCYQIVLICIRPSTEAPFTSGGNSRLSDLRTYWQADPGWSGDYAQNTNSWFDMAQGTMNLGGGVAFAPGCFAITDPGYNGNVEGHEVGHNWGAGDVTSLWDYTGENSWHWAQTGSGYGHSTEMAVRALGIRRYGEYYKSAINMEWVRYNSPVAPWATPDFATTRTNQAVGLNVLINDHCANSNALAVVSFETNTPAGGTVTNLGSGVLRYTPPAGFTGYDWFHYYVDEGTGLKSLSEAHVKVISDDDPLLARWAFDQTNGTTLAESTGRGVAGALKGTASFGTGAEPGVNGTGGLHLDGGGYVQFPGRWFDPLDSSWTLSVWCKPDATPTSDQVLFSKTDRSGAAGLFLAMNGSSFYLNGAMFGGTPGFSVSAAVTPQLGQWYHVVAEVDRSNSLARLWVNGVEYTGTFNTRAVPTNQFVFGEGAPAFGGCPSRGYYLKGTLDEVQLFGRALRQAEVTALYLVGGMLPAGAPTPVDGDVHVSLSPTLSWTAGRTNYQHHVYLGTNLAAVTAATTNAPEFKGRVSAPRYAPSSLASNTTYYWRIDEVEGGTNILAGEVWRFSTAQDVLHGGLRLHYTLDDRDVVGATAYDSAGPPFHDGALRNSPVSITGRIAQALGFNGTNSYIGVGNPDALNFVGQITIAAWIQPTASDGVRNIIEHGYRTSPNQEVGLRISSGFYQVLSWDGAGHQAQFAMPAADLTNWVHLVGEYDGTAWRLFRNGIQVAATTDTVGSILVSDNWSVGATGSGTERFFKGGLDDVMVWNRALAPSEIGLLYTNGLDGTGIDGDPPAPLPGTFTWTGSADTFWTNSANWATNAVPGAGDVVIFDASSARNLATDPGADLAIKGIDISGSLRAVGILDTSDRLLTIGAAGIVMSNTVATLTLSASATLSASQTWSVSDSAVLTCDGVVTQVANRLTWDVNGALTLNGLVNGTGGLTKNGTGTATIAANQNFSGGVTVNGGTLQLNAGGWYVNPFSQYNVVTVNSGATLRTGWAHSLGVDQNTVIINGGTLHLGAENYISGLAMTGGTVEGGELRTWGGTMTFNASAQGALISSPLTLVGSATLSVGDGAPDIDLALRGTIGSGGGLTKTGAGTLQVYGRGSYSGATTLSGGRLQLVNGDDRLPPGTVLSLGSGTTLELVNIRQHFSSFSGSGAIALNGGSLILSPTGRVVLGSAISGQPGALPDGVSDTAQTSGGLTKEGVGTLVLTNTCSYSGDTYVASGGLELLGAASLSGSSNIIIESGATLIVTGRPGGVFARTASQALSGAGQLTGRLDSSGVVSPGSPYQRGLLTISGSYTQQAAGRLEIDLASASSYDRLAATGSMSLAGALVVRLTNGFAPGLGQVFPLVAAASLSGTFATTNLPSLPLEARWQVNYFSTGVVLSVAPNGEVNYISVQATDPAAAEAGLDGGLLTFQRTGPSNLALTASFAVSGTATAGSDYTPFGTTVVFAAGATSVDVAVSILDDFNVESTETVVITLLPDIKYLPGSPTTATVFIADDDIPPVITLQSPSTNGVYIPAGVGLVLEALVTDDGTPNPPGVTTVRWEQVSGPGTTTFRDPAAASTTARFDSNGVYGLRLTASDGNQSVSTSLSVSVATVPLSAPTFTAQVVGAVSPAPGYALSGGTNRLTAAGLRTITSGSLTDDCLFAGMSITGNCAITARVVSVQNAAGTASRAGVMIRESTNGGARSAFVGLGGTGVRYFVNRRTNDSANGGSSSSTSIAFPYYVRLLRTGNVFRAYRSAAGGTWLQVGSDTTIVMSNEVQIGLAAASGSAITSSLAVIDRVGITPWQPPVVNVGPAVQAGSDQGVVAPGVPTLSGGATDDGRPNPPAAVTYQWQLATGPAAVSFGAPLAPTTTVSLAAPGAYVLRLVASDGQTKTFDEVSVSSTGPVVYVLALNPAAAEQGEAGMLSIQRTGAVGSVSVQLEVSGSAGAGADYESLPAVVGLAAGQSSTNIAVTPLTDALSEGPESVILSIVSNAAYTVGAPRTARVDIADTPIDGWRFTWFGTNASGVAAADEADGDGDGWNNLAEYGLGGDPTSNAPLAVLDLRWISTNLFFSYRRPTNVWGITYGIDESSGFDGAWSNRPADLAETNAGAPGYLEVREPIPADALLHFIRLHISRP